MLLTQRSNLELQIYSLLQNYLGFYIDLPGALKKKDLLATGTFLLLCLIQRSYIPQQSQFWS